MQRLAQLPGRSGNPRRPEGTPFRGTRFAMATFGERVVRIGVPLVQGRVAPRCTNADQLLLIDFPTDDRPASRIVELSFGTPEELLEITRRYHVSTLVCDGITRESRGILLAHGLRVVENVVGSAEEVVRAAASGSLRAGFGLLPRSDRRARAEHE